WSYPSDIAPWASLAHHKPAPNWISEHRNNNWDRCRSVPCRDSLECCWCDENVWTEFEQLLYELWYPIRMTICVPISNIEITSLGVAKLSHALHKCCAISLRQTAPW